MIRSSSTVKTSVAVLSLAVHVGLVAVFFVNPTVEMEGAASGAVEARLGNSFADMAAGTVAPEVPETLPEVTETIEVPVSSVAPVETVPPEEAAATEATRAEPPPPPRVVPEAVSALPETPPPEVSAPVPALPTEAAPRPDALVAAPIDAGVDSAEPTTATSARIEATEADPPATEAAEPDAASPSPVEPLRPVTPAAAPEVVETPVPDTLTATSETAVETSSRPMARPERPVAEERPAEPRPQPPATAPGNARENAVAGSATGATTATAPQQPSEGGLSEETGNAAASNYPGEVMRRISRVGRPRVSARGMAVIAFSIAGNGGLNALSVAQSSGSDRLDRAALQMVQRAAPFPPPPPGAQRSFSIQIEGR